MSSSQILLTDSSSSDSSLFASTSPPQLGQQCRGGGTSSQGRSPSPYLADEASHVDVSQKLCKQAWPETFHIYTSCFNEGTDLIFLHCQLTILQEKDSVDTIELSPRLRVGCPRVLGECGQALQGVVLVAR